MSNYEYATDYLYEQEQETPKFTKGEQALKTFPNEDAFTNEIFRRARAIMGMRGVSKPENARLCTNAVRAQKGLEFTEEQLADIAKEVAGDTIYWGVEYFR